MDIVKRILKANQGRDPERLAMKYQAMRSDPFVFFRGTCHLFYERFPVAEISKTVPITWCSGDLHIQNFGSYKGDNRLVYFDINDFDEAAIAPASWELARVLTSILVSADSLKITANNTTRLGTDFLNTYASALATGKARWIERETSAGMIKDLLDELQDRKREDFLDKRTEKQHKQRQFIIDGKKSLPVSEAQRAQVTQLITDFARQQTNPQFYEVLDVARRVAGTGSLGVERYAVLIAGKGSPDQNYLLDLKQSRPSSLATYFKALQPNWANDAERIITIQQRMQAVPIAFLYPQQITGQSYILQELQPSADRVALAKYKHLTELSEVIKTMGQCVAWAQLRSSGRQGAANADELIDFAERQKWRNRLLGLAETLAQQVRADWQTYNKAYDDGQFMPGG